MKRILLLAVICLTGLHTFSQSFMHAVGLSVFVDHTSGLRKVTSAAITYSPRYNMMENNRMSVSIGIPLSIGGSGGRGGTTDDGYWIDDVYYYTGTTTSTPEVKARWMIDIPLMINLNFGALSTKTNKQTFGFYVGGGFGYHYGPVNLDKIDRYGEHYKDSTMQNSYGPVGNAGLRINFSKRTREGLDLRFSYMKSVSKKQPEIYGITAMYAF
ncbi:MAG: hypothetical protein J7623_12390 [Chitinophaga sp.]|uniref:hypothetical protein n=1 Tax=Chitinophaga sp. TaxID=1869181 RepID=UPI001B1A98EC|nr:hypothetical protein [Chitinophaga sp.]MBO9729426.1 hypothetical protein [Chitinophaga sp.]